MIGPQFELQNSCEFEVNAQVICPGVGVFLMNFKSKAKSNVPSACKPDELVIGAIAGASRSLPSIKDLELKCISFTELGHINICAEGLIVRYECVEENGKTLEQTIVNPWDVRDGSFPNGVTYDCDGISRLQAVERAPVGSLEKDE